VHHTHGDVLDVFLGRRFDLRVGHESPLSTLRRGGNGSSTSISTPGRDEPFLREYAGTCAADPGASA
jgi:hypothetical protein